MPINTYWYDAEIAARHLAVGNPIFHDQVYVMVINVICDDDREQVTIETLGDDDGRRRIFHLGYAQPVTAGVAIQYGVDRPDRDAVQPIHLRHGARAPGLAASVIARYGGRLMTRHVIPGPELTGGYPVSDFQPAAA